MTRQRPGAAIHGHQRLFSFVNTSVQQRPSTSQDRSSPSQANRSCNSAHSVRSRGSHEMSLAAAGRAETRPLSRLRSQLYVADTNPTFCIDVTARCAEVIDDHTAWTAEFDGTLCVRSLPTGDKIRQLEGRDGTYCTGLLYIESLQHLWATFQDGFIRVFNVRTMELTDEFVQHDGAIHAILHMEGCVYTGGDDWKIYQWNPSGKRYDRFFFGHSGAVRCLCPYYGSTGCVLFSGSDDSTIKAWDPYCDAQTVGDTACRHTFTGHDLSVLALEAVPLVNQLWSGGEDGTIRAWDLESLECLRVFSQHTVPVSSLMAHETRVWSGDKHGRLLLWDASTLTPLQELTFRMRGVHLDRVLTIKRMQECTSWRVWTAGSSGVIQCWSTESIPVVFNDASKAKFGKRANQDAIRVLEQCIRGLQEELHAALSEVTELKAACHTYRKQLEGSAGVGQVSSSLNGVSEGKDRNGVTTLARENDELCADNDALRQHVKDLTARLQDTDRSPRPISPSPLPRPVASSPSYAGEWAVVTSRHRVQVSGDDWSYVLAERPCELHDVLRDEASMAVQLPVLQPLQVEVQSGCLVAEMDVSHPSYILAEEVSMKLRSHFFARLHDLHEEAPLIPKRGLDAANDELKRLTKQLEDVDHARECALLERSVSLSPSMEGGDHRELTDMVEPFLEHNQDLAAAEASARYQKEVAEELRKDLNNAEAELDLMREENAALLRVVEREAHLNADRVIQSDLHKQLEMVQGEMQRVKEENQQLQRSLSELSATSHKEVEQLQEEVAMTQKKYAEALKRAEELERQCDMGAGQRQHSLGDNEELRKRIDTISGELQKMKLEVQDREENLEAARREVQSLKQSLAEVKEAQAMRELDVAVPPPSERDAKRLDDLASTLTYAEQAYNELAEDRNALNDHLRNRIRPTVSRLERELADGLYHLSSGAPPGSGLMLPLERVSDSLEDHHRVKYHERDRSCGVQSCHSPDRGERTAQEAGTEYDRRERPVASRESELVNTHPSSAPSTSRPNTVRSSVKSDPIVAGSCEAQVLALSVRLTDAEAVIDDLRVALDRTASELEHKRAENSALMSVLHGPGHSSQSTQPGRTLSKDIEHLLGYSARPPFHEGIPPITSPSSQRAYAPEIQPTNPYPAPGARRTNLTRSRAVEHIECDTHSASHVSGLQSTDSGDV